MKKLAIAVIGMALLASCEKKTEDNTTKVDEIITDHPTKEIKSSDQQCYLKVNGKDSIKVNFTVSGDSIKGIYHNLHYGIDKRISTFNGILKNNQGVAISQYSAEGSDYVEELRFTVKGDNLHLNYGPTEKDANSIWRYKDSASLPEHVLPKVDCALYKRK